jgi:hypothetical protein
LKQDKYASKKVVNNKVYLISRGCFYEHLKSHFGLDTLERTFSMNNKLIVDHAKAAKAKIDLNHLTKVKVPHGTHE